MAGLAKNFPEHLVNSKSETTLPTPLPSSILTQFPFDFLFSLRFSSISSFSTCYPRRYHSALLNSQSLATISVYLQAKPSTLSVPKLQPHYVAAPYAPSVRCRFPPCSDLIHMRVVRLTPFAAPLSHFSPHAAIHLHSPFKHCLVITQSPFLYVQPTYPSPDPHIFLLNLQTSPRPHYVLPLTNLRSLPSIVVPSLLSNLPGLRCHHLYTQTQTRFRIFFMHG